MRRVEVTQHDILEVSKSEFGQQLKKLANELRDVKKQRDILHSENQSDLVSQRSESKLS